MALCQYTRPARVLGCGNRFNVSPLTGTTVVHHVNEAMARGSRERLYCEARWGHERAQLPLNTTLTVQGGNPDNPTTCRLTLLGDYLGGWFVVAVVFPAGFGGACRPSARGKHSFVSLASEPSRAI